MSISTGDTTPEKLAAFRAKVARKQGDLKRELGVRRLLPRERQFAQDLRRFFLEARWITLVREFPDGKPLRTQTPWHLALWRVFIEAIEGRIAGAQPAPLE